jgi:hypothetical protein
MDDKIPFFTFFQALNQPEKDGPVDDFRTLMVPLSVLGHENQARGDGLAFLSHNYQPSITSTH